MHVLITNHNLDMYTGTGTFTHTLADQLGRSGHQVTCYSPTVGAMGRRLEEVGATVVSSLRDVRGSVDVIHAHHRHETVLAALNFPGVPMIVVCHGVLPWQEQPFPGRLGMRRYVAVSEEVRAHLESAHGIPAADIAVVRNGIDLTRFRPRSPIAARPRRALALSNYMQSAELALLAEACAQERIALRVAGAAGETTWAVEEAINEVDLVFSLGRGALEAMACQRAVVVYDYNGTDGMVTPQNFHLLRKCNFSGRTFARRYESAADLAVEIRRYDPTVPARLHAEIARDHDARGMAAEYAALYREAMARRTTPTIDSALVVAELVEENARVQGSLRAERAARRRLESSWAWNLVMAYWRGQRWARQAFRVKPGAS
jgi:glycosyltransferase involved in cell wall biosynthesis